MNIQQYYRSAAMTALNGSLAAFVPVILILGGGMIFSVQLPLFLIILPFCFYSFICYQQYLIQQQRSHEVNYIKTVNEQSFYTEDNLLITFLPAPSLRMLLFASNGNMIGEVRDKYFYWWRWFLPYFIDRLFPMEYGLYDQAGQVMAVYRIDLRKQQVKIYDSTGGLMGVVTEDHKATPSLKRSGVIRSLENNKLIYAERSALYPQVFLRNEQGKIIGKLIKGWMPLEWSQQFRDGNTPFITFEKNLPETEKILTIAVLTEMFHYTSH
ncbi:hypothetical protein [Bacillus sp. T3]|uniref:hypothetical protein n=1 Tax=Bacillus sp. T3 TaxID=467262 RepID=UPI002981D58D|nr:hypothetical protein [Bacillus sp. T3]